METSRLEQLFSQPLSLTLKLIHQKLCMDTFRISAWNENTSITLVTCSSISKYWEYFDFTSLFKTRRFRHSFPSLMVVLFKSYFTSGGEKSRSFPKKGKERMAWKERDRFEEPLKSVQIGLRSRRRKVIISLSRATNEKSTLLYVSLNSQSLKMSVLWMRVRKKEKRFRFSSFSFPLISLLERESGVPGILE